MFNLKYSGWRFAYTNSNPFLPLAFPSQLLLIRILETEELLWVDSYPGVTEKESGYIVMSCIRSNQELERRYAHSSASNLLHVYCLLAPSESCISSESHYLSTQIMPPLT